MRSTCHLAAIAAAAIFTTFSASARAQVCSAQWLPGEQGGNILGQVYAFTNFDPDGSGPLPSMLVVGGSSLHVPGLSGYANVLAFDGTRWSQMGTDSAGIVYSLVVHGSELYAGGSFSAIGGVSAANIARWTGATWAPLGTGIVGSVRALASYNSTLYAGGSITAAGGNSVANLARWSGSWSGVGSGITSTATIPVQTLLTFNNVLWIGGSFTAAGGSAFTNLATWNGASFAVAGNPNDEVRSLSSYANNAATSARLVVAGPFTTVASVAVNKIARYNPNTNTWAALGAVPSGTGHRVISRPVGVNGNEIDAIFAQPNGSNPTTYAVYRWDGSSQWNILVGYGDNNAIAFYNGQVVCGRSGQPAAAVYSSADGIFKSLGDAMGAPGPISAITVGGPGSGPANGQIVAAFKSPAYFSATSSNIARRDPATGVWTQMTSSIIGYNNTLTTEGRVHALETFADGSIIAGGQFINFNGQYCNGLAFYDGDFWQPLPSIQGNGSTPGDVETILPGTGPEYFIGGLFVTADGAFVNNIARGVLGGGFTSLGTGVNDYVFSIKRLPSGDLVAGGSFTTAGGVNASRVARWNGTAWSPLGAGLNGTVFDLAVMSDGSLVASGHFSASGSTPVNNIARWTGSAWVPMGAGLGYNFQDVVKLLPLSGGRLLAGGDFNDTAGNYLSLWNGQQWSSISQIVDYGDGPVPVTSLRLLPDGAAAVGGHFEGVLPGAPSAFFARYVFGGPADLGTQGGIAAPDGVYDNNDFIVFISDFFDRDPHADLGRQGGIYGADGIFDNNDFIAFINAFFSGCP